MARAEELAEFFAAQAGEAEDLGRLPDKTVAVCGRPASSACSSPGASAASRPTRWTS